MTYIGVLLALTISFVLNASLSFASVNSGDSDYKRMMNDHCGAMKEPTALCKIYKHKLSGRPRKELPDVGEVDRDEFKNARDAWCAEDENRKSAPSFCSASSPMRGKDKYLYHERTAKSAEAVPRHEAIRSEGLHRDERASAEKGRSTTKYRQDKFRDGYEYKMYQEVRGMMIWRCGDAETKKDKPHTLCEKFIKIASHFDGLESEIDPGSEKKEDAWRMLKRQGMTKEDQEEVAERRMKSYVKRFVDYMQRGDEEVHEILDGWCSKMDKENGAVADEQKAVPTGKHLPTYLCAKWRFMDHDHKGGL